MLLRGWSRRTDHIKQAFGLYRTRYNNIPAFPAIMFTTHTPTHTEIPRCISSQVCWLTQVLQQTVVRTRGIHAGRRGHGKGVKQRGKSACGRERVPEKQHQDCASYMTMLPWKAPSFRESPISCLVGELMTDHLFKGQIYTSMNHLGTHALTHSHTHTFIFQTGSRVNLCLLTARQHMNCRGTIEPSVKNLTRTDCSLSHFFQFFFTYWNLLCFLNIWVRKVFVNMMKKTFLAPEICHIISS